MKLFESFQLRSVTFKNRVVMAPLTRSRALGNIPNDLHVEYYSKRASAGLIITEGTSPSPNGLGYARIPGLFNVAQMEAWKKVTQGVHAQGGKIFVQIMHTGRVSHAANLSPGAKILAPSAIGLSGQMWTDAQGMQNYPVPQEMTQADIETAVGEYEHAAELAIQAGFDGVELHGANGYLIEQFMNPLCNQRSDAYGGTPEGRMRFVLELAQAVVKKMGGDRTGIRLSPYGVSNDTGAFPGIDEFFKGLAQKLSDLGLLYLHLVDHSAMGAPTVSPVIKTSLRETFQGALIRAGGYDAERAEQDLQTQQADLIAFGRPFISNPDLVAKMKNHTPLKAYDSNTFYTPGPEGYTQLV
jgi:N-ethylmaleimide reductase